MKLKRFLKSGAVAVGIAVTLASCTQTQTTSPQDILTIHDEEINQIISGMSLEEKVEMLHSKTIMSSEGIPRLGIQEIRYADGPFGIREEIGDMFRPKGWTIDSATYFPTGSALAATWSPDLAYKYGTGMAHEATRRGKDMVLGPAMNIQRIPVGGRTYEYFSEDPLLAGALAVGYVKGVQDEGRAVCLKHFAVNNQENDRGTVNAIVDERTLREIYLKPFEVAVKEGGAWGVMTAYNKVNGNWCSENPYLNNKILRGEWGFNGMTVSDWGGTHSTMGAALGGLNVQMTGDTYLGLALIDSVNIGKVPESVVDDKVREILRVRYTVRAIPENEANIEMASQPEEQRIAYEVASKSVVLLKNENNILPIDLNKVKNIAVIGQNAVLSTAAGGMGAGVKTIYEISPLQGLQNKIGNAATINYAPGYKNYVRSWGPPVPNPNNAETIDEAADPAFVAEAVKIAKEADLVLYFAGTNKSIETEGKDRENIDLPVGQNEIAEALIQANPNLVTVIISGGPCDLRKVNNLSKAMVQGWWNGLEGGNALADVLLGNIAPSGKLPFTFPLKLEDSPAYAMGTYPQKKEVVKEEDVFVSQYRKDDIKKDSDDKKEVDFSAFFRRPVNGPDAPYSEGLYVGYRWFDSKDLPVLYPFGYGLSYVDFNYSELETNKKSYKADDVIEVSFNIQNNGSMEADEVPQVYLHRVNPSIDWPNKELKAFSRVTLQPGEVKTVSLEIPVKDLRYWDEENKTWQNDMCDVELLVGSSVNDILLTKKLSLIE
ncbi:glycoside hydrolase family 3 C-terminal domain-containing protein [Draconibacterium sp. IB214405]|uniref:glycoside hydrolase family 3 C-terminal domain-containing protein n=1 Tax=Draconibacterium sp. IB214405 TaxID=3097352 RepID=UPI002A0D96CC|nr:glycoside hydrolase family 3 C-terminal domain-containing protein [Draconibacterium sp. IB214405]MDX8339773.1 glycoside hydrolase family 3 C-terminal domain-containing protein [Draconibacterium sp. IB214405]